VGVVQRQEVGGLTFTKSVYMPHAFLPTHTHRNAYFSFVAAGSYTERVGRIKRECGPLSMLMHESGETHEDVFHACPVELLRIEETGSQLLRGAKQAWSDQLPFLCQKMLRELSHADGCTPIILHGLAHELVGELRRASARKAGEPSWLSTVDQILNETFRQPLDLASVAIAADVHPVHLCRAYRKHRRQTVGERMRELRLQSACRLLVGSMAPVGEVALECGFSDQSHLARLMRKRMGLTPSEYRRAHHIPNG
jgi:AraC family transcriptional regulator